MVVALLLSAASCGAKVEGPAPWIAEYTEMAEQPTFVRVQNMRRTPIWVSVIWGDGRADLGPVSAQDNKIFPVDMGPTAQVQMMITLEPGNTCITFPITSTQGQMLTLIIYDGPVNPEFCAPIQTATETNQDPRA